MDGARLVTRRVAIKDMGKAGMAMMVFGAACTNESATPTTVADETTTTLPPRTTTTAPAGSSTQPTTSTSSPGEAGWARVDMGFVSAYIIYRSGEAALVDTGQAGAANDITATLETVDIGWDAVSSIIGTHRHPDHIGSLDAAAGLASNATIYGGAGDLGSFGNFDAQGPIAVGDNDSVFDLDIIETPGHTPGHICVLDSAAGILVTGDAMNTNGGRLNSASADPSFTADLAQADESVRKLAGFEFEIVLVGHGEPILEGGSQAVGDLASSL